MNGYSVSIDRLRALIGRQLDHAGHRCEVLEILEEEQAVVLCCLSGDTVIQADQHGEPRRRVPETYTIPVFGPDGDYDERFLALGLLDFLAGDAG